MSNLSFKDAKYPDLEKLVAIKAAYLNGQLTAQAARQKIEENYSKISGLEFAYSEQRLKDMGFDDDKVHDNMDNLIGLLEGILEKSVPSLPAGHPVRTYMEENTAIKAVLDQMDTLKGQEFSREKWQDLVQKLYQFNTHLSRKQNQLFSKLEEKGFDRPSKIMWTFDNKAKKGISNLRDLVKDGDQGQVHALYDKVKADILDLMDKEESVLYPTSINLISDQEFALMRIGDDEIGYCLIPNPGPYKASPDPSSDPSPHPSPAPVNPHAQADLVKDLAGLVAKYQLGGASPASSPADQVLDVKQGKLSLDQINLIFQHLPVDLSYVDENELVKFYSDTSHRIFPRSAGVIGRNVMNCHPRESVHIVQEIIEAFRSKRQDKAEFWIQMGDKFIYILYVAVRDQAGNFRGVLEMMQDASHIRSLEGQRRLLNWDPSPSPDPAEEKSSPSAEAGRENPYGLSKDTIIYDMIKKYPYLRDFLPTISPKYEKILKPVAFNTIAKIATLEMAATRGDIELDLLIEKLSKRIEEEK